MNASDRGVCIWLTGPSGAGKTTLTRELVPMLEAAGRTVSVFDTVPLLAKLPGERTSEGKLLRKAFVAGEVAKHGGVAVCVTISSRAEVRRRAREIAGPERFVEVRLSIPVEVAEARRRSRGSTRPRWFRVRRILRSVADRATPRGDETAPDSAEVTVDVSVLAPAEAAATVFAYLVDHGFVTRRPGSGTAH